MKIRCNFLSLFIFIFVIGCGKKEDTSVNYFFNIEPQGENDVLFEWDETISGRTVQITIDNSSNFDSPIVEAEISTLEQSTTLIGLSPLTFYYAKINVKENGAVIWDEIKEFTSGYTKIEAEYGSSDGVVLAGILSYVSTKVTDSSKKVVFMHEFSRSKSSWLVPGIFDTLLSDGYVCFTFDFRGHGGSSRLDDRTILIDEPWLLKKDFDASMAYLNSLQMVCSNEVVVFGGSMGACVATVVSSYENVIGGVVASPVRSLISQITNNTSKFKGIYYFAGELDKSESRGTDFAKDANWLFDLTNEPKEVEIVEGSYDHGSDIFFNNKELRRKAISWVRNL